MKVQTNPNQTNPKPNSSQGMEVFLSPKKEEIQVGGEKTKVNTLNPSTNIKEEAKQIKINKKEEEKEIQVNLAQNKYDEIEENIRKIEEQLRKSKTLDITTFNQLVYTKHLKFKLLLVRSKIYVAVTDGQKITNIAIEPPRWGGSSLRYMISSCLDWCYVIEKSTSKGKILSYQPVSFSSDDDTEDIFD